MNYENFTPDIGTENMMFLRDRWKREVNFFIREFWKSFSDFISGLVTLLLWQKVFIKDF